MKFHDLLYLFLIAFFVSCSSRENETLNMNDLLESEDMDTTKENEGSKVDSNALEIQLSFFSTKLIDTLQLQLKDIHLIDNEFFPDRFNPLKSEKWEYKTNSTYFRFKHWKFKDTMIAQSTFLNWIDSYGVNRISLRPDVKQRISKDANVLLMKDKSIVVIESFSSIDLPKILATLEKLGFGKYWKYCVFQQKMKTTKWLECSADTSVCYMLK